MNALAPTFNLALAQRVLATAGHAFDLKNDQLPSILVRVRLKPQGQSSRDGIVQTQYRKSVETWEAGRIVQRAESTVRVDLAGRRFVSTTPVGMAKVTATAAEPLPEAASIGASGLYFEGASDLRGVRSTTTFAVPALAADATTRATWTLESVRPGIGLWVLSYAGSGTEGRGPARQVAEGWFITPEGKVVGAMLRAMLAGNDDDQDDDQDDGDDVIQFVSPIGS